MGGGSTGLQRAASSEGSGQAAGYLPARASRQEQIPGSKCAAIGRFKLS